MILVPDSSVLYQIIFTVTTEEFKHWILTKLLSIPCQIQVDNSLKRLNKPAVLCKIFGGMFVDQKIVKVPHAATPTLSVLYLSS